MKTISLENVQKKFNNTTAVDNISFEVSEGKIFGLLGPNGAGKTTTIRMIAGIIFPDKGNVEILGKTQPEEYQKFIGYLPEERGLYRKVKVIEQLIYFAQLKGMHRRLAYQRAMQWLETLDSQDLAQKRIQELSKGMQQKIQFISALIHDPEILILDEPFSGFDPINVDIFKQIIMEFKQKGKTILLSTHIMEQAEQLCDEVCLINKGKIILKGSIDSIKSSYGRDTVICEFNGDSQFIRNLQNVKIISLTDSRIEFRISPNFNLKSFVDELINSTELIKFELTQPSLREIFISEISKTNEVSNEQ